MIEDILHISCINFDDTRNFKVGELEPVKKIKSFAFGPQKQQQASVYLFIPALTAANCEERRGRGVFSEIAL